MSRKFDAILSLVGIIGVVVISIQAGPDAGYDFFNYHIYSGINAEAYRLNVDFFAADLQSTLNPYAMYLPYKLIKSIDSPVLVVLCLALSQSIIILPIVGISRMLMQSVSGGASQVNKFIALGVAWAVAHPITLAQFGTSYADLTTAIPVMIGMYLLLHTYKTLPVWDEGIARTQYIYLLGAGMAFGISVGLKLSNAFPVIGAGAACLAFRPHYHMSTGRISLCLVLGGVIGLILSSLSWWLKVYSDFGNPFLPFFSGFFPNQLVFPISNTHSRFIPNDIGGWMLLPFVMNIPAANIYTEAPAPDSRYSLLIIIIVVLLWLGALRKIIITRAKVPQSSKFLALMCGITYLLWSVLSANGRYAIPLHICTGLLVAQISFWLQFITGRPFYILLLLILQLQVFQIYSLPSIRWNPISWQEKFILVDVPEKVKSQPALYIGLDGRSHSWLLAYAHPSSAMTQLALFDGTMEQGRRGERLREMQAEWHGKTYALMDATDPSFNRADLINAASGKIDGQVSGIGYRVSSSQECESIGLQRNRFTFGDASKPSLVGTLHIMCPIEFDNGIYGLALKERAKASGIMDALEDRCPNLFIPRRPNTIKVANGLWYRSYANTDLRVAVAGEKIVVSNVAKGMESVVFSQEVGDPPNSYTGDYCLNILEKLKRR